MSGIISELVFRELGHTEAAASNVALAAALLHSLIYTHDNVNAISALRRGAIADFAKTFDSDGDLRIVGIKSINRVFDLALRTVSSDPAQP